MSQEQKESVQQTVEWQENNTQHKALWLSQSGYTPPTRIVVIDDTTPAGEAYRMANAGTSMLWRGDFHNAKQLMQALNRRIDRSEQRKLDKATKQDAKDKENGAIKEIPNLFHLKRQAQAQRARLLSRLLLQLNAGYVSELRRAPKLSEACSAAFGKLNEPCLLSYRDLQGALGAAQWRKKGIKIEVLGLSIYPHYGVFAPTRHEYVQLLLDAPLPADFSNSNPSSPNLANQGLAFDIGTGTGLLSIILAKRGIKQVIATDVEPRAIDCAHDNFERLGLSGIELEQTDLYPTDAALASLIVCNPPWIPAKPSSPLEYAVYDANSTMLRGLLQGAKKHLAEQGEVWLILSDLAEHLRLRTRSELLGWIADAGLTVKYRLDTTPTHGRSQDDSDPLYEARSNEVTSLWCLV